MKKSNRYIEVVTGFKLPTDLKPKPHKVIHSSPKYVNGVLTSKGK